MRRGTHTDVAEGTPDQGGSTPLVAEIVRRRRAELGLTLAQVAERAGCARSYVSEIENGKRARPPGEGVLAQLERALELAPGRLREAAAWQAAPEGVREQLAAAEKRAAAAGKLTLLLAGPARQGGGRSLDSLYKAGVLHTLAEVGAAGGNREKGGKLGDLESAVLGARVPIINAVAAGYPSDFTDLGYPARIADEYLPAADLADPDAFAARVVGDSMEPEYREGDIVVFSPARGVREGDDCFARLEPRHEATFKRVFFETGPGGEELIRLQPLNGKYPPVVVGREEVAGLYAAVSVTRAVGGGRGGGGAVRRVF